MFSPSSTNSPSTRARTKPSRARRSNTSRNSPFCRRTTGASSMTFVFGGSARILSTMSLVLCVEMGTPVSGTMRLADVRVKQAQVIVNFRRRGDDRARAAAGTSLLNRNGRRKSLDEIHVRLLQLVQKLPRVGGKRFDVFALALGVNRVERERRFAAAAQAGDDHQLVARNLRA